MWLALTAEVALRRSASRLKTTIIDFQRLDLFDSEHQSHFNHINRIARYFNQDSVSRFRRKIRALDPQQQVKWISLTSVADFSSTYVLEEDAQHLMETNLKSETLSWARSNQAIRSIEQSTHKGMKHTWLVVFQTMSRAISLECPGGILVFNGRFIKEGAARAAGLAAGVDVFAFDKGPRSNSIAIYRNHMHDAAAARDLIEHTWDTNRDPSSDERAESWYIQRVEKPGGGNNAHSLAFTQDLTIDKSRDSRLISIFTSSSNELTSIDTADCATPELQDRWLQQIRRLAANSTSYDFFIRLHPSTISTDSIDPLEAKLHDGDTPPNFKVIGPQSALNTYQLIQASDLVLTFGSTVTAEAAFLGKPVVELATGAFSLLEVCSTVRSMDDLMALLNRPELALRENQRHQAIKFAHYLESGGDAICHVNICDPEASLEGTALEPFGQAFRLFRRVYRKLIVLTFLKFIRSNHGFQA